MPNENEDLRLMSRIPLYLNIICSLYHEDSDIDLGDSPLELYTWEMAFLLQKHICKDQNISELPTIQIFNESLGETIIWKTICDNGLILNHYQNWSSKCRLRNNSSLTRERFPKH